MTPEFLFFADLVLLLRLGWLLADRPIGVRGWIAKTIVEAGAATLLLPLDVGWIGVLVTSVLVNGASLAWERTGRERNAVLLALGLVQLALLSVWLGPAGATGFRPWVGAAGAKFAAVSALGGGLTALAGPAGLKALFGLLLTANEPNLLIRWVLGRLRLHPGRTAAQGIDEDEFARGRVIGVLERALIYFFVLNGQFGAVGFTLAVKGFTRFKELDNRSFAEYVLIGTLLSSGLAMLAAVTVQHL